MHGHALGGGGGTAALGGGGGAAQLDSVDLADLARAADGGGGAVGAGGAESGAADRGGGRGAYRTPSRYLPEDAQALRAKLARLQRRPSTRATARKSSGGSSSKGSRRWLRKRLGSLRKSLSGGSRSKKKESNLGGSKSTRSDSNPSSPRTNDRTKASSSTGLSRALRRLKKALLSPWRRRKKSSERPAPEGDGVDVASGTQSSSPQSVAVPPAAAAAAALSPAAQHKAGQATAPATSMLALDADAQMECEKEKARRLKGVRSSPTTFSSFARSVRKTSKRVVGHAAGVASAAVGGSYVVAVSPFVLVGAVTPRKTVRKRK